MQVIPGLRFTAEPDMELLPEEGVSGQGSMLPRGCDCLALQANIMKVLEVVNGNVHLKPEFYQAPQAGGSRDREEGGGAEGAQNLPQNSSPSRALAALNNNASVPRTVVAPKHGYKHGSVVKREDEGNVTVIEVRVQCHCNTLIGDVTGVGDFHRP